MKRFVRPLFYYRPTSAWTCPWCYRSHPGRHKWCDHPGYTPPHEPKANDETRENPAQKSAETTKEKSIEKESDSPEKIDLRLKMLSNYIDLFNKQPEDIVKEEIKSLIGKLSSDLLNSKDQEAEKLYALPEFLMNNSNSTEIRRQQELAKPANIYYDKNKQALEFINIITGDAIRSIFAKDDKKDKPTDKEKKEKPKSVDDKDIYDEDDIKTKIRDYWTHGDLIELKEYIKNIIGKQNSDEMKQCKSFIDTLEKTNLLKNLNKLINIQGGARGALKTLSPNNGKSQNKKGTKKQSSEDMLKSISKDLGDDEDEDPQATEEDSYDL